LGGSGAGGYLLRAEGSFREIFAFLGHLESLPFLAELGKNDVAMTNLKVVAVDNLAVSYASSEVGIYRIKYFKACFN